jgi:hypothetical protein
MTTTGESRTRVGNRLFDRFVGVRRPSFPQPRRLNTAKQNSRHRQSGRASTRIFRSACLSFLQLPRKSTEARAERPPTSSDFCEIYSIWGMSNGVPEAYDPRGHLMKHENKATEYMVETRAGRLNFAIATVIGLLTLASGLLGPAQSSTAAEKPSEGQAPAQERIVIDPSQIEDQKGLSARAQSGQSTEPIKAETTCSKDPDGASICVTLGEQEESGLKPHAALPLPKNLCKSGVRSSDRTNGCVGVPLTIKHHSGKGAVLGTLTGTAYVYQYSATNQTRIGNQLTLVTSKTSGTGNQFSIVGNTPKCSGSCSRTGALTSLAGKALKAGKTLSAESYYNWTGKSARTNQNLSWNLTIKHPRVAHVLPFNYAGASPVRCDREYKSISAGCIMTKP